MSLAREMMIEGFNIPHARGKDLDIVCGQFGLTRQGEKFSFKLIWAWYDLWMGAFWDQKKRRLYVMLLPTLGFYIQTSTLESDEQLRERAKAHLRAL